MTDPHGWWGYRPGIMTVGAVKPGHAPDGETRKRYTAAIKEYDRCKDCPLEDCSARLCPYGKERKRRNGTWDKEKARRLWDEGVSQNKIAGCCGVAPSTISAWVKQQGLTRAPREELRKDG